MINLIQKIVEKSLGRQLYSYEIELINKLGKLDHNYSYVPIRRRNGLIELVKVDKVK